MLGFTPPPQPTDLVLHGIATRMLAADPVGIGLAASGGYGEVKREQFLLEVSVLAQAAKLHSMGGPK
jgi:hypothetical protein